MASWLWNLIPLSIVLVCAWMVWRAGRQPLWAEAFRRLRRNPMAMVALCIILVYVGIAVLDSVGWQDRPAADSRTALDRLFHRVPERTYSAPRARLTTGEPRPHPVRERHLLGTDIVGNDVLYLTLKGCRTAVIIAGLTSLIATAFGLLFGLLAGYFGKYVDDAVQYVYTTLDSIPGILLLIALLMVMDRGIP
jgi:peptide/nickel transport system permease protein